MKILQRAECDGTLTDGWILIMTSNWSLCWHKHAKSCRYGVYVNWSGRCGLKACLNIPFIGDFSIWI